MSDFVMVWNSEEQWLQDGSVSMHQLFPMCFHCFCSVLVSIKLRACIESLWKIWDFHWVQSSWRSKKSERILLEALRSLPSVSSDLLTLWKEQECWEPFPWDSAAFLASPAYAAWSQGRTEREQWTRTRRESEFPVGRIADRKVNEAEKDHPQCGNQVSYLQAELNIPSLAGILKSCWEGSPGSFLSG